MLNFLRNPDSPSSKYLSLLVDLFYLNILFLVTSIPIVTVGSSLVATHTVTGKLLNEECGSLTTEYFHAFKDNLKRGLAIEAIFVALGVLVYTSFIFSSVIQGGVKLLVYLCLLLLIIFVIIEGLYLFGYTARYQDSLLNSFKVCFQVALLNKRTTLYLFGIIGFIFSFISFGNFMFALGTFLLFLIGFSGISMVFNHFIFKTFAQYEQ